MCDVLPESGGARPATGNSQPTDNAHGPSLCSQDTCQDRSGVIMAYGGLRLWCKIVPSHYCVIGEQSSDAETGVEVPEFRLRRSLVIKTGRKQDDEVEVG